MILCVEGIADFKDGDISVFPCPDNPKASFSEVINTFFIPEIDAKVRLFFYKKKYLYNNFTIIDKNQGLNNKSPAKRREICLFLIITLN